MTDERSSLSEASEAALAVLSDARTVVTACSGFTTPAALEQAQDALRRIRAAAPGLQMQVRGLLAAEMRRRREEAAERAKSDERNAAILAERGMG